MHSMHLPYRHGMAGLSSLKRENPAPFKASNSCRNSCPGEVEGIRRAIVTAMRRPGDHAVVKYSRPLWEFASQVWASVTCKGWARSEASPRRNAAGIGPEPAREVNENVEFAAKCNFYLLGDSSVTLFTTAFASILLPSSG